MKENVLIRKILFIALCMSFSACLQVFQQYFFYWRPVFFEEIWRLWTSHWVHVGWIHYLLNMIGLASLPFIFPYIRIRHLAFLLFVLPPLLSISFYFIYPSIEAYAGLSGILHGMYVAIAIYFLKSKKERNFSILVLLLILGKIIWENIFGSLDTAQMIGSPVLIEAHLMGVVWGSILSILFLIHVYYRNYKKLASNQIENNEN